MDKIHRRAIKLQKCHIRNVAVESSFTADYAYPLNKTFLDAVGILGPGFTVTCYFRDHVMQPKNVKKAGFYRPRDPWESLPRDNHAASPFFKVVRDHFDTFEKVYPEKYQAQYGYWRSVIRTSIDKFIKCGDEKEGFARVRCPDCKGEFFVAFSCRQ